MYDLEKLQKDAHKNKKATRKFFTFLKKKKPKDLDFVVADLHEKVFEHINCLDCGNCCKVLGPRITKKDIANMSKALGMKQNAIIDTYLRIDEDDDYVFKTMPCPFLMDDNYCSIYENRPKACEEYPHTESRKFHTLLDLTAENNAICPAIPEIIEGLRVKYEIKYDKGQLK